MSGGPGSDNLPPGVKESDIPGCRLQDKEWGELHEWIDGLDATAEEIRRWIEDGIHDRQTISRR